MLLSQSQGPRQDAGLPWPQRLWLIRVSGSDVRKIRTHSSASRPQPEPQPHALAGRQRPRHRRDSFPCTPCSACPRPGKAKVLFEGGYAHPGPSLLGKRQGNMACVGQTGPTPRIKGRGKGACSACMQRPQRRQHARTSGSGSEPGARTGIKGPARKTGGAACTPFEKPGLPGIPRGPVLAGLYTGKADQALASHCTIAGHTRSLKACRAG